MKTSFFYEEEGGDQREVTFGMAEVSAEALNLGYNGDDLWGSSPCGSCNPVQPLGLAIPRNGDAVHLQPLDLRALIAEPLSDYAGASYRGILALRRARRARASL